MDSPWFIDNTHLLLRIAVSLLLGALIGFERERKNHAAGLRTHILVCLGSCLIMILSIYGFADFVNEPNVRLDPARLAAQVITGVGFLGAGTIVITGRSITGLTTAASVWVVMAIGLSVGAGFYVPAVFTAVLVLLILWGLNIVEQRFTKQPKQALVSLHADDETFAIDGVKAVLEAFGVKLVRIQFFNEQSRSSGTERRIQLSVVVPQKDRILELAEVLRKLEGVKTLSLD